MNIQLEETGIAYRDGHTGLHPVSLRIAAGEQVAIIGPSGAGKTSLLRLIATGLRPSSGRIEVGGNDPWVLSETRLQGLRSRIGTVHQAPPLPPRQRVVTAVLAGRVGAWSSWRSLTSLFYPSDIAGARAALSRLDLANKVFVRCDQLSGGELQRVGIARVLYQEADLVLADEPVSAMDPTLAAHTLSVLAEDAQARSATLIVSLHAVELALARFPRILGVRAGRILFDKPAEQVLSADLQALYDEERVLPGHGIQPAAPTYHAHPL